MKKKKKKIKKKKILLTEYIGIPRFLLTLGGRYMYSM